MKINISVTAVQQLLTVKCDIGKNGYSNLKTHLITNHGNDWKDWLKVFKSGGKGPMDKYFLCTSDKAENIYDWIEEWIVDDKGRKERMRNIFERS